MCAVMLRAFVAGAVSYELVRARRAYDDRLRT
jgi:hypothetical protein